MQESLAFDVTVNVEIDGEVGVVNSIEFPDAPEGLSAANRECLTDVMSSISFDGMDGEAYCRPSQCACAEERAGRCASRMQWDARRLDSR